MPSLTKILDTRVKVAGQYDCWEWIGTKLPSGYGRYGKQYAHRLVYELVTGPIPAKMTIDHLCNNPSCVNPVHLAIATQRENILRSESPPAMNARKTHCKRGHLLTVENTYLVTKKSGRTERWCKECCRKGDRERKATKRKSKC
jgi:hypothetical protein